MQTKSQLPLILTTAFLDILGLGILIPVLPEIVERFGIASSWSGYTQGIYAFGMLIGGLIFGRLSDARGRKNILMVTSLLNLVAYILMACAIWHLPTEGRVHSELWVGFTFAALVFLFSRLIGGLGGAGYGVIQAYISDISSPNARAKNFGLMGAMFGLGFLVGPAIGAISSELIGIHGTIMTCIVAVGLNVILIWFFLSEPTKHIETETVDIFERFRFSRDIVLLLVFVFGITIAFSSIQAMSGQYYKDVFGFSPKEIGYTMSVVGLVSIIYQGFLVKYVRKLVDEVSMIRIALIVLMVGFAGFAMNTSANWLYFWVIFFPLGMGSLHSSISALLSEKAGKEVGKVMGYHTSVASIGQIVGPIMMGSVYAFSSITIFSTTISHYTYPFYLALLLFIILFFVALSLLYKK